MVLSVVPYPKILCFMIQYIYPIFETVELTSKQNRDNVPVCDLTQLLFYWIICGSIITLEKVFYIIKELPFYYDLKILLLLWLLLPTYSGSGYIYYMYVDKLLNNDFKNYILLANEFKDRVFNLTKNYIKSIKNLINLKKK